MVKLDAGVLRYMSKDEFRVLASIEMGMKNHEYVPTVLISRISSIKNNSIHKIITLLHKNKLITHNSEHYSGYKLTYAGYDYLALYTLVQRNIISSIGRRVGVGKESDIYECYDEVTDTIKIIKIHRLGRISFRQIRNLRDYTKNRNTSNWLYLSRLAAQHEYKYMKCLYDNAFNVPIPYDCNRHIICMSYIQGYQLGQVNKLLNTSYVYNQLINMVIKLAEYGLIHCDFNEYNIMIDDDEIITMIDFPQMVSTSHINAVEYFNRDIQGIQNYFRKKFGYIGGETPVLHVDTQKQYDLDIELKASGIDKNVIEQYNMYVSGKQTDVNDIMQSYDTDEDDHDNDNDNEYQSDSGSRHSDNNDNDSDNDNDNDNSNNSDIEQDHDTIRRERNHARKAALRQKHAERAAKKLQQHQAHNTQSDDNNLHSNIHDNHNTAQHNIDDHKSDSDSEHNDSDNYDDDTDNININININDQQHDLQQQQEQQYDNAYERELALARLRLAKQKLSFKSDKQLIKVNKNRNKIREYKKHKEHIKEIVGS